MASMTRWEPRRGSSWEEVLKFTHHLYRQRGVAVIEPVAVPVRVTRERGPGGRGHVAYFHGKSTIDFMGVLANGRALAADAKSTRLKTRIDWSDSHFPSHQQAFLAAWHQSGGLALLLVRFTALDRAFVIPYDMWARHVKPSWSLAECAQWGIEVAAAPPYPIHYLAPFLEGGGTP